MEVSDRDGGHVKAVTDCMAWFSINRVSFVVLTPTGPFD